MWMFQALSSQFNGHLTIVSKYFHEHCIRGRNLVQQDFYQQDNKRTLLASNSMEYSDQCLCSEHCMPSMCAGLRVLVLTSQP